MPLRMLLRYLKSGYSEQAVQKLADSYPIRRAAQLTAYAFQRGKDYGEEAIDKVKEAESVKRVQEDAKTAQTRLQSFSRTLSQELKEGFRDMNEELKKKRKD